MVEKKYYTRSDEQLERKIFGPRKIVVISNNEKGENIRASANRDEQGNETLNNEHDII